MSYREGASVSVTETVRKLAADRVYGMFYGTDYSSQNQMTMEAIYSIFRVPMSQGVK